jgi:hypothetical protein
MRRALLVRVLDHGIQGRVAGEAILARGSAYVWDGTEVVTVEAVFWHGREGGGSSSILFAFRLELGSFIPMLIWVSWGGQELKRGGTTFLRKG